VYTNASVFYELADDDHDDDDGDDDDNDAKE